MRLLLTAVVLVAGACSSAPSRAANSGVYSNASPPQMNPDAIAGCNAVNLRVDLAADGVIRVNGEPSSMDNLKEAALKKDAACQNAAAIVVYSYQTGSPPERRDEIELLLKQGIVNLTLIEAGQG